MYFRHCIRQCIFAIALPVENGVDIHLKNKIEYPSPKDSWWQIWPCGFEEDETCTNGQTTDDRWSEKITLSVSL